MLRAPFAQVIFAESTLKHLHNDAIAGRVKRGMITSFGQGYIALAIGNDVDIIAGVVREVLQIEADDGVGCQSDRLSTRVIRDAELYAGVRLAVPARVDRARTVLRADVNVGDPVTPAPVEIEYPGLLAGSFRLLGYPLATVLAEKLVTMIDRASATTREPRRRRTAAAVLCRRLSPQAFGGGLGECELGDELPADNGTARRPPSGPLGIAGVDISGPLVEPVCRFICARQVMQQSHLTGVRSRLSETDKSLSGNRYTRSN